MNRNPSSRNHEENVSFAPLTRDRLPELMEISDVQALEYVSQLLQQLISLHDACKYTQEQQGQRDRTPSFEVSTSESETAVQRLVPARNFTINTGPESKNAPVFESVAEFDNAVELYKRFWLKEVPSISISQYLQRFHRYCRSSAATYLTAGRLIYLLSVDRHIVPVTRRNVYRLFCAAFMVAAKFIEDTMYPMSRYATTAGLKKSDLARLETTFLLLADFDVKVDREMLKSALHVWADLNAASEANVYGSTQHQQATCPSTPVV